MKYLFFFFFVPFIGLGQVKNLSTIDKVNGSNNLIKVIQGSIVVEYNLNSNKDAKRFLEYLQKLPAINKEIKKVLKINQSILNLLKKINGTIQDYGVFDVDKFVRNLETYIKENEKLKAENEILRTKNKDGAFLRVLIEANKKLQNFDNEGYQFLLSSFIRGREDYRRQSDKEISEAYYLQAKNNYNNYRFEQSLIQINKALQYWEDNSTYLFLKVELLNELVEYDESLSILFKVLAAAQSDSLTSEANNYIGVTYNKKGDNQMALEFLLKALSTMPDEESLNYNYDSYINIYSNIGGIYSTLGKYEKALEYSFLALNANKKNKNQSDDSYILSLNNIGSAYFSMQKADSALYYYNQALEISKRALGTKHLTTALILDNIGVVFGFKEEHKQAISYLELGLNIEEEVYGKLHPRVGTTYDDLGLIYDKIGDTAKAMDYVLKALRIYRNSFGETHPRLSGIFNNLAVQYQTRGLYDSALLYYNKSLVICEKEFGLQNYMTKGAFDNIGFCLISKGNSEDAIPYLKKSGFWQNSTYEKAHTFWAYGKVKFDEDKKVNVAINFFELAQKLLEESNFDSTDLLWVNLFRSMAIAYCSLSQKENALIYFNKALDICYKVEGAEDGIEKLKMEMGLCK